MLQKLLLKSKFEISTFYLPHKNGFNSFEFPFTHMHMMLCLSSLPYPDSREGKRLLYTPYFERQIIFSNIIFIKIIIECRFFGVEGRARQLSGTFYFQGCRIR
ncbi:hypothetical protein DSECCO2_605930 [anaerobic digester metagenome]